MNWDNIIFAKKTALGYKTLSNAYTAEATNVIISTKQYIDGKNEIEYLNRQLTILNNDLENKKKEINAEIRNCNALFNENKELKKQIKDNEQYLEETKKKDERLKAICNSFIRQCKERSNQEKGQTPKKQHTGYSLITSNPKDYQYIYKGSRRKALIFESVFQTPYPIDYSYFEAYELVDGDVAFGEDEDMLLDYMGADEFSIEHRYEDVYDKYSDDDLENKNIFYNQNIRMNGRDGYWELILNHTKPLSSPPSIMRFPKKNKSKDKNNEQINDSKDND